jgi:hypothetical protein
VEGKRLTGYRRSGRFVLLPQKAKAFQRIQGFPPGRIVDLPTEPRRSAEFLLDFQEPVVLDDAFRTADGAGLDLPSPVATAKSAMKVSSVSPERWERTEPQPALRHRWMASTVSVTVPIWLSLMSAALQVFSPIPLAMKWVLGTRITPRRCS